MLLNISVLGRTVRGTSCVELAASDNKQKKIIIKATDLGIFRFALDKVRTVLSRQANWLRFHPFICVVG